MKIDALYLTTLQGSASNYNKTPTKLRDPPIKLISNFRCEKSEKKIEYRITNCKVMNIKTSQLEASRS